MREISLPSEQSVTVVIPAYNLEKYLPQCVHSVQHQSYDGLTEVIILDDGSTDQTLRVAQELAAQSKNIRVFTQTNGGRVAARNRLLELAKTEFIAWIDADDMATTDWLKEQVMCLANDPALVAVSGQGYAVTAGNFPIGPIEAHPLDHDSITQRHVSGQANAFFQSCVTVRKSAVIAAGAYNKKFPAAEDYDLWLRLAEYGRLHNINQIHLVYRIHPTSANSTISIQQRRQGWQSANEAREKLGIDPLVWVEASIPAPKKDDWNRRIYWLNIALKSGNSWTGLQMAIPAWRRHPTSLVIIGMLIVASLDSVLFLGNRTDRFRVGERWEINALPKISFFKGARWGVRVLRSFRRSLPAA